MRIIPIGVLLALRLRMITLWQIIRTEGPTWPNLITVIRFVLVIGMFVTAGRPATVFWLAFVAWVTDWVDGFLAKRLNQCTRLGARLDQWTDWLFGFALLYAVYRAEPLVWYNILLASSIIVYLIARMWYLSEDTTDVAKWKTFMQFFGAVVVLAAHAWDMETIRLIGYGIIVASLPLMYGSLQSYRTQQN